ncbi:MAG: DUF1186 domain-containing protein [Candidatus Syntrophoarchaeum sp.]|nr:DUF1186 domain-containing protein [Candidatus Syntrophoarchaeum sp.]
MAKQKKQEGKVKGRREKREIEERENSIAQMSTSELLEHMTSLGLKVSEDVALEMARREDAIFYLRKMLQDAQYWYQDGPGDAWMPIHAIHILALIKTSDALELLLDVMRYRGKDLSDWLTEDTPALLAAFGEDAVKPLKEFASDETLGIFVRGSATTALNVIAHRYPAHRDELINHFRMLFQDTTDRLFAAMLIGELVSFKDPDVLDVVYSAFDEDRVDTFFMPREEVDDVLNASEEKQEYMMFMKKDPLDHFSEKNIDYLAKITYSEEPQEQ